MPQPQIANKLHKQSAGQLLILAGAVIAGLTNNPAFPNPPVDLKTLQAAADDLNAALVAQVHGGTKATAEKNNRREALIGLLRTLKHYVEDDCGGDVAVLLSSGFPAAAARIRSPLANPSILSIDFGNTAELVLKVTRIANAKCYELRMALLGAGNVPGPWETAGVFTVSRSITVPGLVRGKSYMFQVRAIGGSTGYTDWSNPVSHMCG